MPFKGTFQGTDTPSPPTLLQSLTGSGTHVGLFSSTAISGGSPGSISANGDTIETTYIGAFGGHVDVAHARWPAPSLKTVTRRSRKLIPSLAPRVDSPAQGSFYEVP